MARFEVCAKAFARIVHLHGVISVTLRPLQIVTTAASGVKRRGMMDLSTGLRMACRYAGDRLGQNVPRYGTAIDPDESENGATFQIFPKDDRYKISFARDEFGHVKAIVPSFRLTDIPSAVQVAFVMMKIADLMEAYEKAP